MLVRFTRGKRSDVLTCRREDGTTTWMAERPDFVAHDLAHYAVETVFGYRLGFFGLVAHGWELSAADFGRDPRTKERYPWPGGAQEPVEYVVSLIQRGPEAGIRTPDELREALRLYWGHVPDGFTDERIAQARRELARLEGLWAEVPAGGALELEFPPAPETVVACGAVDEAAPAAAERPSG
jgi:hypothetical protein